MGEVRGLLNMTGEEMEASLFAKDTKRPMVQLNEMLESEGMSLKDLENLTGAIGGSKINVESMYSNPRDKRITAVIDHPSIDIMRVTVLLAEKKIKVDDLFLPSSSSGMGTRIVNKMIKSARAKGLSIHMEAWAKKIPGGSRKGQKSVGYQVWPKLGFNGPVPTTKRFKQALADSPYKGSKKVRDILRKPGGVDWWARHGDTFQAKFDTRPESEDSQIFQAYIQSKGIK